VFRCGQISSTGKQKFVLFCDITSSSADESRTFGSSGVQIGKSPLKSEVLVGR
jgi:hypothetical protein